MQYVNDDMDELFRKASESYPLDTQNADWNKIIAALQEPKPAEVSSKNEKGRLLWLLLLLPLGLICNRLYTPYGIGHSGSGINKVFSEKKPPSQQQSNSVSLKPVNENSQHSKRKDREISVQQTNQPGVLIQSFSENQKKQTKQPLIQKQSQFRQNNQWTGENGISQGNVFSKYTRYISPFAFSGGRKIELPDKGMEPVKNTAQPKPITGKKERGIYAGIMGGVNATTVKFQKVPEKSMEYGLLIGYRLNKKWSIESGVYWENKFYYSDGKYFNTSWVYIPPNSKITEVSGDCKMIEIPLNFRYGFSANQRSGWFGTAGASSYFMKKEDYNYVYYYGNSGTYATHYKKYSNSSKYYFSVLQLSGGYTRSLGKISELRIEPYLKIPIAGMGVGKLPLLSAGLRIGLTKKF